MDKISIVSVTYRSLADTRNFVESVVANTIEPYEFIMGVNGPVESDLKDYLVAMERKRTLRLVWVPTNIGVRLFHTVMRLAKSDFVYRCDSDIEIAEPYWTEKMRKQWEVSNEEIGNVVGVGTSNTSGHQIKRTASTTEVDMVMSNCVLFHMPSSKNLHYALMNELPRMESHVAQRKMNGGESYAGEIGDLETTLDFAKYHAPYLWDPAFGGLENPIGYGSDDFLVSLLLRWAGLKLVTSSAKVVHKDASMRPYYQQERHILVSRGFQYFRTAYSLISGDWSQTSWNDLPNNLPVLKKFREGVNEFSKTV